MPSKSSLDANMPSDHVAVGRVLAPHGLRGEMKIEPLTSHPEDLAIGRKLWVDETAHEVEASRQQKGLTILRLSSVTSVDEAESLRGRLLTLPESELAPLAEDEFYSYQLIGLEVVDLEGTHLGKVVELIATGSNDVYVVNGPCGELLLPAIDDVIVEVDLPGGRMVVSLMEGMLPGRSE